MGFKILIIDDELDMCVSLARILSSAGYETCHTTDPLQAEAILSRENPDLLVMDVRMPGIGGLQLLARVRRSNQHLPILMISGFASAENIVQAMKIGASNFFTKPLKMPALLEEIKTLSQHVRPPAPAALPPSSLTRPVITRDPGMQKVLGLLEKVARTDVPVVITGESGTGKELAAMAIHEQSSRATKPLVKLNCAAIPETLIESELFGHEKGAFTDAGATRIGKFEEAEGGTIFLDEIGELSLKTQAKLLRVLQEKQFERLGSNVVRHTDVRIIAATNRNFESMIQDGSFRGDLFYRLSVVKLELPPLRQRRDDILFLAKRFREEFAQMYGKHIIGFEPDVEQIFLAHSWPGNIRELRNCVERAVIFTEHCFIQADSLPLHYDECCRETTREYHDLIEQVSREKILEALDKAGGNKTAAANLLNLTRRTLYNKLKSLEIPL